MLPASADMTEADWRLSWRLYSEASGIPSDQREEWLAGTGANAAIVSVVREMLAEDERPDTAGAPPDPLPDGPHPTTVPYRTVGPYRIIERVGEGAMGTVYRAEQAWPLRRQVAIKIVREGLQGGDILARFDVERHALALMDHPNIARVFDAGTAPDGRPYFAMEFAAGVSLSSFVERNAPGLEARLDLFQAVCDAIEHAHLKGVIHRDIKPSNILVCESPERPLVKVIDFGVAKALGPDSHGPETEFGRLLGTLEYMSPEQAAVGATGVDTRADIYSLGVLLYELLTGTTPITGASGDRLLARLDRVQSETAEPPSRRTVKLSTARGSARRGLPTPVPRDLDWIVLKALEKDPARRYQTVHAFARDLVRFRRGDTVEAGPASLTYRVRKFARRNRAALAAGGTFVVFLVGATALSLSQAARAREAERAAVHERNRALAAEATARAERDNARAAELRVREERGVAFRARATAEAQTRIAHAVSLFLREDLLAQANPNRQTQPGGELTVRAVLDRASRVVKERFTRQPEVHAEVEETIGSSYHGLGLFREAEEHARTAWELRQRHLGRHHPLSLVSLHQLGAAYRAQGRYAEAEKAWLEVWKERRRLLGSDHPATLQSMNSLGAVYRNLARNNESESFHRAALRGRKRVLGAEHPDTLTSANNLGVLLMYTGRAAEAEPIHRENLNSRLRTLGAQHPDTLISRHNVAMCLLQRGQNAEAATLFRETADLQKRVLGPEHVDTLNTLNNLGVAMEEGGSLAELVKLREEVLQSYTRSVGKRHSVTLVAASNLALTYKQAGRLPDAEKILRETWAAQKELLGADHPDTVASAFTLADLCCQAGWYEECKTLAEDVVQRRRRLPRPSTSRTLRSETLLATALAYSGKSSKALDLIGTTLAQSRKMLGDKHEVTGFATGALLEVLIMQGKHAAAEQIAARVLSEMPRHAPYRLRLHILELQGRNRFAAGKPADAEPVLREVVTTEHEEFRNGWQYFVARQLLGHILTEQGKAAEARPFLHSGAFERAGVAVAIPPAPSGLLLRLRSVRR